MPYKKKFKLPGSTLKQNIKQNSLEIHGFVWNTSIKKFLSNYNKNFNLLGTFWDTFVKKKKFFCYHKKKFFSTIKKISLKL